MLRLPSLALLSCSALLAQQAPSTLATQLELRKGTHLMFAGRASYRMGPAKKLQRVSERELRVEYYVLRRKPTLELARVVRARPAGSEAPFVESSLRVLSVEPAAGKARVRIRTTLGGDIEVPLLFYPELPWPTPETHASEGEISPRAFGLQQERASVPLQWSLAARGTGTHVRSSLARAHEVATPQGRFRMLDCDRSWILTKDARAVTGLASTSTVEFSGYRMERSLELTAKSTSTAAPRLLAEIETLRVAVGDLETEPAKALARLSEGAQGAKSDTERENPSRVLLPQLRAMIRRDAHARIDAAAKAKRARAALQALVGKPAPDFELKRLDGRPFSLRDARGRLVFLTFWGVG